MNQQQNKNQPQSQPSHKTKAQTPSRLSANPSKSPKDKQKPKPEENKRQLRPRFQRDPAAVSKYARLEELQMPTKKTSTKKTKKTKQNQSTSREDKPTKRGAKAQKAAETKQMLKPAPLSKNKIEKSKDSAVQSRPPSTRAHQNKGEFNQDKKNGAKRATTPRSTQKASARTKSTIRGHNEEQEEANWQISKPVEENRHNFDSSEIPPQICEETMTDSLVVVEKKQIIRNVSFMTPRDTVQPSRMLKDTGCSHQDGSSPTHQNKQQDSQIYSKNTQSKPESKQAQVIPQIQQQPLHNPFPTAQNIKMEKAMPTLKPMNVDQPCSKSPDVMTTQLKDQDMLHPLSQQDESEDFNLEQTEKSDSAEKPEVKSSAPNVTSQNLTQRFQTDQRNLMRPFDSPLGVPRPNFNQFKIGINFSHTTETQGGVSRTQNLQMQAGEAQPLSQPKDKDSNDKFKAIDQISRASKKPFSGFVSPVIRYTLNKKGLFQQKSNQKEVAKPLALEKTFSFQNIVRSKSPSVAQKNLKPTLIQGMVGDDAKSLSHSKLGEQNRQMDKRSSCEQSSKHGAKTLKGGKGEAQNVSIRSCSIMNIKQNLMQAMAPVQIDENFQPNKIQLSPFSRTFSPFNLGRNLGSSLMGFPQASPNNPTFKTPERINSNKQTNSGAKDLKQQFMNGKCAQMDQNTFRYKTNKGSTITSNYRLNCNSLKKISKNFSTQKKSQKARVHPVIHPQIYQKLNYDQQSHNTSIMFDVVGKETVLKQPANQFDLYHGVHREKSNHLFNMLTPNQNNSNLATPLMASFVDRSLPKEYEPLSPNFGLQGMKMKSMKKASTLRKSKRKIKKKYLIKGFSTTKKSKIGFTVKKFRPQNFTDIVRIGYSSQSTENNIDRHGKSTQPAFHYSGSKFSTIQKTRRLPDVELSLQKQSKGHSMLNSNFNVKTFGLQFKAEATQAKHIVNSSAETIKNHKIKKDLAQYNLLNFDSPKKMIGEPQRPINFSGKKILSKFSSPRQSEDKSEGSSSYYYEEEGEEEDEEYYDSECSSSSRPLYTNMYGMPMQSFILRDDGMMQTASSPIPGIHPSKWSEAMNTMHPFNINTQSMMQAIQDQQQNHKKFHVLPNHEFLYHYGGLETQEHQKGCKISCTCGLWQAQGVVSGKNEEKQKKSKATEEESGKKSKASRKSSEHGSQTTVNFNYRPHFNFTAQNYMPGFMMNPMEMSEHPPMNTMGFFGMTPYGMVPGSGMHFQQMGQCNHFGGNTCEGIKEESENEQEDIPKQPQNLSKPDTLKKTQSQPSQSVTGTKRKQQQSKQKESQSKKQQKQSSQIKVNQFNHAQAILETPPKDNPEESNNIQVTKNAEPVNKRQFKSQAKRANHDQQSTHVEFQVPNSCSKIRKTKQSKFELENSSDDQKPKVMSVKQASSNSKSRQTAGNNRISGANVSFNKNSSSFKEDEQIEQQPPQDFNPDIVQTPQKKDKFAENVTPNSTVNPTMVKITQHNTNTLGGSGVDSGNPQNFSTIKGDFIQYRTPSSVDKKDNPKPFNSTFKGSGEQVNPNSLVATADKNNQLYGQSFNSNNRFDNPPEYSFNQFNIEGVDAQEQSAHQGSVNGHQIDDKAIGALQNASSIAGSQAANRNNKHSSRKSTTGGNNSLRMSVAEKEAQNRKNEDTIKKLTDQVMEETVTQEELFRKIENQDPRVTCMGCKCKSTKCLKLYCECLRNKAFCGPYCQCKNQMNSECFNNEEHIPERRKAVADILKRNPEAFESRVDEKRNEHFKGCKCKNSMCQKNYCECYERGVPCVDGKCKCKNCKNTKEDCERHGERPRPPAANRMEPIINPANPLIAPPSVYDQPQLFYNYAHPPMMMQPDQMKMMGEPEQPMVGQGLENHSCSQDSSEGGEYQHPSVAE